MKLTKVVTFKNLKLQGDISSWMFYVMILLVISMPLSEFGMSISQIALFLLWLHEGAVHNEKYSSDNSIIKYLRSIVINFKRKIRICSNNKMLLLVLGIYIMHIVGLLYTTHYKYAFNDLRIKLPILVLPLIFASMEQINSRRFLKLLQFFVMAVITGTIVGTYIKLSRNISDTREISIFISHIRFALMICFSIFIITFLLVKRIYPDKLSNFFLTLILLWLIIFIFILKALTGVIIFSILLLFLIINYFRLNKKLLTVSISIVILMTLGSWYYINSIIKNLTIAKPFEINKLDKLTSNGHQYIHDTLSFGIESGSHVGLYISEKELEESWNNKSLLDYNGRDNKGQQLKTTLIRYLHSRGLRKDANGIDQLTSSEIKEIENGVANVKYLKGISIHSSIEQLIQGYYTYKNHNDPNASSFMQRIEYWKTSLFLINNKPLLGYGTGDIDFSFKQAFKFTNSNLSIEFQHRSHNQFFAIWIALGLIGLIVFISGLIIPPFKLYKFNNYFFVVFFIIITLSMLTEDTLETQPGATFFAFFHALLLFGITNESDSMCRFRKSG